jgi:hypothetical protein
MRTIARSLIGSTVAVLLFDPTVATAQKVGYDFRPNTDFTRPRTFAFKIVPPEPTGEQTGTLDSPFVDERTNVAIASQLERRGWTRVNEHPDVYVVTRRGLTTQFSYYAPYWQSYSWPWWGSYPQYGYGLGAWDPGWGTAIAEETHRVVLTIDLEDAASGDVLWRGVGSKHLPGPSKPSSRTKYVNDEVADIFKYFPPPGR